MCWIGIWLEADGDEVAAQTKRCRVVISHCRMINKNVAISSPPTPPQFPRRLPCLLLIISRVADCGQYSKLCCCCSSCVLWLVAAEESIATSSIVTGSHVAWTLWASSSTACVAVTEAASPPHLRRRWRPQPQAEMLVPLPIAGCVESLIISTSSRLQWLLLILLTRENATRRILHFLLPRNSLFTSSINFLRSRLSPIYIGTSCTRLV